VLLTCVVFHGLCAKLSGIYCQLIFGRLCTKTFSDVKVGYRKHGSCDSTQNCWLSSAVEPTV